MGDTENKEEKKVALYRHFSKDEDLLYIGISNRVPQRIKEHVKLSHWFEEVASITIEWCDSRVEAMDKERNAIKDERPKWNIVHNKMDEVLDEIADKVINHELYVTSENYWSQQAIAASLMQTTEVASGLSGISIKTLEFFIERGYLKSVLFNQTYSEKHKRHYYKRGVFIWSVLELVENVNDDPEGLLGLIRSCENMAITHPFRTDIDNNKI